MDDPESNCFVNYKECCSLEEEFETNYFYRQNSGFSVMQMMLVLQS